MKKLLLVSLFIALLGLAAGSLAHADEVANPLGLFYDNSFTNIESYYRPGALLVSGNCNRYDERFEKARQAGAEVLTYLNSIEVYDRSPCKLSAAFYMGGYEHVPKWPYPTPGQRINYHSTHMTDMRAGSEWSNNVVNYISGLMREGKVDGVFLDNVGARLWSQLAQWKTWSKSEQDEWTRGNVDLVRRLDEARRRINPKFILINNNLWDRGDELGLEGERYVDGVVLEHPKMDDWHRAYAAKKFGSSGHRRLLVIVRDSPEEAMEWAKVPGVTHVTVQGKYDHPGEPLTTFHALNDRNN
jgi:hypothetical protein